MKRIRLIAAVVLCSLVLLVGSSFAAMSQAAITAAAKAKYNPEYKLQTFKYSGGWITKKEWVKDNVSGDWSWKVEQYIKCTVTTDKEPGTGVYKIYTGKMFVRDGEFNRFYIDKTDVKGLKKLTKAEILANVISAFRNFEPKEPKNIFSANFDALPSDLIYIASIKLASPDNFVDYEDSCKVYLDITYGHMSGNDLIAGTRTYSADIRKKDGAWRLWNLSFKEEKNRTITSIPQSQSANFKNYENSGFDGIYGLTEPAYGVAQPKIDVPKIDVPRLPF
ncbi:MAG: hypothetical protein WC890_02130 [Candidatus Margulisiibacteriota bacterium]